MQHRVEIKFWKNTRNGTKIDIYQLLKFLESKNIRLIRRSNSIPKVIRIKEKSILVELSIKQLNKIITNHLKSKNELNVFNEFIKRKTLTKEILNSLKEITYKGSQDNKNRAFFFYLNGVVKITKDKISLISYKDYKGHVYESEIISRKFDKAKLSSTGIFEDFVHKLAEEESERIKSFRTMIGYCLHSFKNKACAKAIILVDKNATNISANGGGNGKSLILEGIGKIKKTHFENGKQLTKNQFMFQSVTETDRIVVLDDIRKDFDFESIYVSITGDFKIEKKGKDPINVPFEKSAKIAITSNYPIPLSNKGSLARRRADFEVSDYFSPSHSPEDEYGKLLFDEFDETEWSEFDCFMAKCQQEFLEYGLIVPEPINLISNMLEKETSKEFVQFMDNSIELEKEYDKETEHRRFIKEFKLSDFTKHSFTKYMKKYAEIKDLTFKPRDSNGKNFFKFVDEAN